MKFLAVTLAALVGAASAATTSSFVSCKDKVPCLVYHMDPKINKIIARCKPNNPTTTMPCNEAFCCAVPVPKPVPCDPTVKCDFGYAKTNNTCIATNITTPCTEAYCCKPKSPTPQPCSVAFPLPACPYGYANVNCPLIYSSTATCTADWCCKPKPPPPNPNLMDCAKNGVVCKVYNKDPKTHGNMRCKNVTWATTSPCTQKYCCTVV